MKFTKANAEELKSDIMSYIGAKGQDEDVWEPKINVIFELLTSGTLTKDKVSDILELTSKNHEGVPEEEAGQHKVFIANLYERIFKNIRDAQAAIIKQEEDLAMNKITMVQKLTLFALSLEEQLQDVFYTSYKKELSDRVRNCISLLFSQKQNAKLFMAFQFQLHNILLHIKYDQRKFEYTVSFHETSPDNSNVKRIDTDGKTHGGNLKTAWIPDITDYRCNCEACVRIGEITI